MKDKAKKIKSMADEIFALKGVKNGEISFVTLV
jgi:metal-responsive CopG/Arc/MetJ family transcriptional regulator